MSSGTIEFDSVVSDNAKILILKQITTIQPRVAYQYGCV